MKVSELTGALLDLWVAKADKKDAYIHSGYCFLHSSSRDWYRNPGGKYSPSTNWAQGGSIAEREQMQLEPLVDGGAIAKVISPGNALQHIEQRGETYLIAICRCKVASKFGDGVPNE